MKNMLKINTLLFWSILFLMVLIMTIGWFVKTQQALATKGAFYKENGKNYYSFNYLEKDERMLNVGDGVVLKSSFLSNPIQGKVVESNIKNVYIEDGKVIAYRIQVFSLPESCINNTCEVTLVLSDKVNLLKLMLSKLIKT